jgi:hypothetical protein
MNGYFPYVFSLHLMLTLHHADFFTPFFLAYNFFMRVNKTNDALGTYFYCYTEPS